MPTKTTRAASKTCARTKLTFSLQVAANAAHHPSARKLRHWAAEALQSPARVTVRIIGRREGRRLNRTFRGRDYATNVLTFTYTEAPILSGDIALCAPVIRAEALSQAKSLEAHYAHLLVHGMLHLQGHDHIAKRDARVMEAREVEILHRLGYDNPY